MTAIDYIRQKGFEHRIASGQAVLKNCPFCGDPKFHFYIDPTEGAFFCHKCQERGNLITLQKHLGDYRPDNDGAGYRHHQQKQAGEIRMAFQEPKKFTIPNGQEAISCHECLLNDQEARDYITGARGINIEAVKHFKIGLKIGKDGSRWLSIPHYAGGKLINVKYRSLPPAKKTFRRIEGCKSILFNMDALDGQEEIFLCEGELDAITLWDQGIKNAVATTTGAGGLDPEWIDQLSKSVKIYLCYDNDEAGQKGAREAARRLGYDRCFNVLLPDGKDVNELFCNGTGHSDFNQAVNEARKFDVAGIMSFQQGLEVFSRERNKIEATGLKTGFPDLDRIIKGGFNPGELVILGAPPKIGKSTFALQIVTHNALQGNPALFFCLEMRPMKIIYKVMQCHNQAEEIGKAEIEKARIDFKDKPLYLGYCHQKPTLEAVIETIKAAIRRYGLKLVAFDHLHFLCRSLSNQTQEISLAVQSFKFMAEELEVPVILIAQPRKLPENKIMGAMDLKDSISVYSDCDHLIILHRDKATTTKGGTVNEGMERQDQAFSPITLCRVEASRYGPGGECLLYYHGEYSRFDVMAR